MTYNARFMKKYIFNPHHCFWQIGHTILSSKFFCNIPENISSLTSSASYSAIIYLPLVKLIQGFIYVVIIKHFLSTTRIPYRHFPVCISYAFHLLILYQIFIKLAIEQHTVQNINCHYATQSVPPSTEIQIRDCMNTKHEC